jgi:hypothetical protein
VLSAFVLAGCAKRTPTTVAGSDEEMLDRYTARLEELRVKLRAENPGCDQKCSMTREVCDLATRVCEIAAREAERRQARCASAQEQCASFGDACASCQR